MVVSIIGLSEPLNYVCTGFFYYNHDISDQLPKAYFHSPDNCKWLFIYNPHALIYESKWRFCSDEELLLCVCLLEFVFPAMSVPKFAKIAFWMEVVFLLNINIL